MGKWRKNKFVYTIVSYEYVYCSLTVKKDEILVNRLFRGKNLCSYKKIEKYKNKRIEYYQTKFDKI